MFTIPSLTKILILAGFVLLAWYLFRRPSSIRKVRNNQSSNPKMKKVQDMEPCPECGAYISADSAKNCGKDKCPY